MNDQLNFLRALDRIVAFEAEVARLRAALRHAEKSMQIIRAIYGHNDIIDRACHDARAALADE
jgi:hypothetical protein